MRLFYFLILLVILGAVGIFAVQNPTAVTLRYLDRSVTTTIPILTGCVYVLGMVTGWTVIGFVSRSLRRVAERPRNENR